MSLNDYLRPGDGVLDLGANVGHYARTYADLVGPSGYVLACEPDPDTAETCRRELAGHPQAYVLNVGVDSYQHRAMLYRDQERKRNSLWSPNVLERDHHSPHIEVDLRTLDSLTATIPNLRGIKMDTQGAEMRALQGGRDTLARTDLVWAVEIWPMGLEHAGSSVEELVATFEAAGYVPVGQTWDHIRIHGPSQQGHSAMDVVLMHQEEANAHRGA